MLESFIISLPILIENNTIRICIEKMQNISAILESHHSQNSKMKENDTGYFLQIYRFFSVFFFF